MPERAPASFPREREAEVIVVGGGPAGSTVATTLAEAGHRVLLLDKAAFPRHKACSEYINPAAAQLLGQLGLGDDILRAGAHRMAAMLVHAPDGRRFVADFARAEPGQAAFGLSRYRLDHLLLERAKAAGVTVRERAHVRQVVREGGRVVGVAATINGDREWLRSSLVIGADGHNSVVSRELGLDTTVRWPRKTGLVAHYRGVTGLVRSGEMHVASGLYAGLAPLEDGLTNVAVVAGGHAVTARSGSIEAFFTESLRAIPAVARKLDGAERVGGIRGAGAMARRARRTAGAGYLLIGDAASFLDPFTGDGIYEALRAAQLAAPVASVALRAGDTSAVALDPYRIARRRAFTAKRHVCWIVQGFIHAPPLMNYVTARLSRREELALTLSGVLGNFYPASQALSPRFLARLLRP
ncbi:MAG: FAD-dependent monooxygenase [Chloroflexia bacterium]|nr:FAD-dependent monooxygenase [Chloroflexia bacterium]